MAIELSTAGILVKWAVEATAGTRPTTGYKKIRGIKNISDFNPEPEMLEVTDLSDAEWRRHIPGLKDANSIQSLTVNDFADFRTDWDEVISAFNTAKVDGKEIWIEYSIPNFKSFYYCGIPSKLGFNGAEVGAVLENVAFVTPNKIHGWDTSST